MSLLTSFKGAKSTMSEKITIREFKRKDGVPSRDEMYKLLKARSLELQSSPHLASIPKDTKIVTEKIVTVEDLEHKIDRLFELNSEIQEDLDVLFDTVNNLVRNVNYLLNKDPDC